MGNPRPHALHHIQPNASTSTGPDTAQHSPALRLWLLGTVGSADGARIQQAAADASLSVSWIDAIESAPSNAGLIGVGPSVADPLRVARQLRVKGPQAMLLFFAGNKAAGDALKAELIRDPFIYPRFEIIELQQTNQQLASRLSKVASRLQRRTHMRRTTRLGRARTPPSQSAPAEPLLAHVLSQTRDAVLSADLAGRPLTWNEPAARLFGLPSQLDQDLKALLKSVAASGEPRELRLGESQVVAHAAPVRDADGKLVGVSVVARDDSEYERVQAALREANRQKDEFLAIMSHELRTPLTSILGYADMVLRGLSGPLAPMTSRYVTNVRTAGDRLLEIVNGLLDYTRLEANAERLDVRRVDLANVVSNVVRICQTAAAAKEVRLSFAVAGDVDATVEADEERITHVFRSMLGNALKFTPAGGSVQVNVQPDQDAVCVSITDSGIGMRPDQVGRVWERFYQGDASLTRPYGGMGLGLSIARHLVSLHGGRVGAESRGPDRGSTFWFSIPKRRGSA